MTALCVQTLGAAAIALDIGRWQRRNQPQNAFESHDEAPLQAPPPGFTPAPPEPLEYPPTSSIVHFITGDMNRGLKALRKSQPRCLHQTRQLVTSLHACQVLSLTRSLAHVRSLVRNIMFIAKDVWKTAEWVTFASDEVVCAVVDRLVQHAAWWDALQVLQAALTGAGASVAVPKVRCRNLSLLGLAVLASLQLTLVGSNQLPVA
jgi:hypothetical protein